GSSVTRAAQDARQKLFERASPLLGVSPDDVDTEDGMLYVKSNPQSRIRWIDAMGGDERIITGLGSFDPDYSMPCFFMIFVEVEVDVETGQTELLIVTGATDVGQVIDPVSLKMQLEGALGSAGLDSALFEETVMDKNTGHVLTGNMVDYKWRTSLELPTFQNVIVETPLPSHIFGAIGAGEVTTSPAPSAVLMAVSNAIGKRVTTYPVTPDKILKAWSER
ncbi:MAG: molybdopterin cofactor-binding domain-containing protein, partial [Dehalococcoidia bacterium]